MENTQPTAGGVWGIMVVMAVLAYGVIFKYLVPRGFKEWRKAGEFF